ncbi:hypothetical protein K443DRAFT_98049 [Laccaria amethystina LaAM-08-1]|uniref:Uncharacterized protein n=1 Tax=Laccaria amethystina LaAM-08-1 TaxID=1095629 RepID=A0A0C9X9W3_9AGAR|nr:hypothetical protein K443DRAFT_98049 [Laccaria amethystina LaAM-08-1]
MTTPSTATPAAIAFRDKALSTFKSSMDVKDPKEPNASLVLLALAAGYCVKLIATNDPLLLTHHSMHNVLFLVRNEYNALTSTTPAMATPAGYQAVTNFCREIQVARNSVPAVPAPITPQDKALADIAERGYIIKQRPCKIVKSKAIIEDKEDDEVEFVSGSMDIDYTMGPNVNIAYRFAQMAMDNIFGDEEVKETPTPPKDKSKKRAAPGSKVCRCYYVCP